MLIHLLIELRHYSDKKKSMKNLFIELRRVTSVHNKENFILNKCDRNEPHKRHIKIAVTD